MHDAEPQYIDARQFSARSILCKNGRVPRARSRILDPLHPSYSEHDDSWWLCIRPEKVKHGLTPALLAASMLTLPVRRHPAIRREF